MGFQKLKEYLDNRGKVINAPKVVDVPDYTGKVPSSPQAGKKDKDMGGATKAAGKPAPYKAGKDVDPNKPEKGGFGEKGKTDGGSMPKPSDKLKPFGQNYGGKTAEPKNAYPADPKKVWKMQKTEHFLDKTQGMSLAEFTQYMMKECGCDKKDEDGGGDDLPSVTAYAAGKFHPHPPEAIKYIAALAKKNPRIMDMLIHELKRQDGLGDMLGASLDHPESYTVLTDLLGDDDEGPGRARSLASAMHDAYSKFNDDLYESVAPPYGYGDDTGDTSNGFGNHNPDPMSDEDDPNADDDRADTDGAEDDSMEDPNANDTDAADPGADDDSEDQLNGDEKPSGDSKDDDEDKSAEQPKKLKKRFAHDHVLDAMSGFDHMREKMKAY